MGRSPDPSLMRSTRRWFQVSPVAGVDSTLSELGSTVFRLQFHDQHFGFLAHINDLQSISDRLQDSDLTLCGCPSQCSRRHFLRDLLLMLHHNFSPTSMRCVGVIVSRNGCSPSRMKLKIVATVPGFPKTCYRQASFNRHQTSGFLMDSDRKPEPGGVCDADADPGPDPDFPHEYLQKRVRHRHLGRKSKGFLGYFS